MKMTHRTCVGLHYGAEDLRGDRFNRRQLGTAHSTKATFPKFFNCVERPMTTWPAPDVAVEGTGFSFGEAQAVTAEIAVAGFSPLAGRP
jgi:hypothetical protein